MRRCCFFIISFFNFYIAVMLMTACSHIDEADRLIFVKSGPSVRCVLLEDFTGQRCVNCPRGAEVIEQLQEKYGDSTFIAVGIHGGPLAFKGNDKLMGLATDFGDEYFNHWNLEYQPVGLINRHGAVNYTDWAATVKEELERPATLTIKAEADIMGDKVDIRLTMLGTDGTTSGKLQIWLLEDGIKAMQLMPNGTANSDYVHNHVLRTPVNGIWGEDFTIKEAEIKTTHHTQILDPAWNTANLSIVAFVYNDQGVQQACKGKVNM